MRPIISDTDLTYYENKLHGMSCPVNEETHSRAGIQDKNFAEHIVCHKGKLVKVEMTTGRCVKVGTLIEVGNDYICLRVGHAPVSVLIPFGRIQVVTVVHNNDRRNISQY